MILALLLIPALSMGAAITVVVLAPPADRPRYIAPAFALVVTVTLATVALAAVGSGAW